MSTINETEERFEIAEHKLADLKKLCKKGFGSY